MQRPPRPTQKQHQHQQQRHGPTSTPDRAVSAPTVAGATPASHAPGDTPPGEDVVVSALGPYGRLKGRDAARERYGSIRTFVIRTLYTWFTMTLLAQITWPLLVLQLDAPGSPPADTPIDWFQLRLIAPVLVALLAAWLWRLSPVPHGPLQVAPARALLHRGRIWPQALLLMTGTLLLLVVFALIENPAGGLKLTALALAEAAVIQILCSGYLQGMFALLLPTWRPTVLATVLYMLAFALRALLALADEATVGSTELLAAGLAGAVVGLLLGGVCAVLRSRSSSLLPGTLLLWLVFVAFGLADVYES